MGVVLPGYLDEALDLIGVSWPNVNEDDYREMARAMREFADDIENTTGDVHQAIQQMVGANEGPAVDALQAHWDKIRSKHLTTLAELGRGSATALDGVAAIIEGAKLAAIVELGILAAEIASAVAAAPVTLGISTLGGLAGTQVCRIAVKRIFKEAARAVVEEIVARALEPVTNAIGAMAGDLVVQLGSSALGLQNGVDAGRTAKAGREQLKLAGVDGGDAGVGGGSGGSGRIRISFDSHETLETQLADGGERIHSRTKDKIGRARHHQSRTRGKDAIADAANTALDKVLAGVQDAAGKVEKHIGEGMAGGVRQMRKNHQDNDRTITDALQGMGTGNRGRGPEGPGGSRGSQPRKYFVHDDGRVQEIRDGKFVDLDPDDRSGIHDLLNPSDNRVKDPSKKDLSRQYHARKDPSKPHEKVSSQKISEPTDLSRVVEEARRAGSDYGGKNYAALLYRDEDGNAFVLAGRSGDLRSHSERSIGKPFLGGRESDVHELYTERAPCQKDANCERWLARHFEPHNPDLEVSHGVDYDSSVPTKDRDWAHRAYVGQLEQDHQAGNYDGTMGTDDFDERGRQDKDADDARRAERQAKRARRGL